MSFASICEAPGRADRLLDLLREHGEVGVGDRTPLAGLAHAGDDLLPAERLHYAVALDDVEARGLGRAEAAAAFGALPAATDGQAVVARARVDDAGIGVPAEGAEHGVYRIPAVDGPAAKRESLAGNRAVTAAAWAGRSSAVARATMSASTARSASRS